MPVNFYYDRDYENKIMATYACSFNHNVIVLARAFVHPKEQAIKAKGREVALIRLVQACNTFDMYLNEMEIKYNRIGINTHWTSIATKYGAGIGVYIPFSIVDWLTDLLKVDFADV